MKARGELEVQAPPSLVMGVLEDFERYPEIFPDIRSARVLAREARAFEVAFSLKLVRPLDYTLRLIEESVDDALVLRWTLVEGAFRTNDGRWTLRPLDGGRGTKLSYELELRPGMFIPRTIENTLMRHGLPSMMEAVRTRAESLALAVATSGPSPGGIAPADA